MRLLLICVALLIAACASNQTPSQSTASAADVSKADTGDQAPKIVDADEFLLFLDNLEAGLDNGDPRRLNDVERKRADELMAQIRDRLEGIESVDELSPAAQRDLYNDTQMLWTTVIGRTEDQVICRREHQVGTHRPRTRCRTIGQIREDQETARRALRNIYRKGLVDPSGVQ
ncbi:MAG: hypothetical protein Kow0020_16280 [Wenzhouxiangellaceae bacterium]